jgi:hypothetical protein
MDASADRTGPTSNIGTVEVQPDITQSPTHRKRSLDRPHLDSIGQMTCLMYILLFVWVMWINVLFCGVTLKSTCGHRSVYDPM